MSIDRRLFVGSFVVVAAGLIPLAINSEAKSASVLYTSLPTIRDILLPGLWCVTKDYGSDYESDIMIDYKADALIVKAYRFSTKQEFGFAILRPSIESNRYKAEFKPTLDRLFKILSQAHSNES